MNPQLTLGFILLLTQGFGQNLIPDPYFNQLRNCSDPPKDDFVHYWYCTSGDLCDAYHVCIGNIPFSPTGDHHKRYQKKGDGMVSILLLTDLMIEARSYIASPLSVPLVKDQAYYVRFFISPKKYDGQLRNIVADVVGMNLTHKKTQQGTTTMEVTSPQIERMGTFFEDYDQWYKIHGKYIARGGEKYAIIGNFRSDEESNYKYTKPPPGAIPNGAYAFIDDVLIEAFNPLPDTMLFCASQTTVLNAGFHDATYQWNTGDRDSTISVSRSGKYKVHATIDTLVFEDSTVLIYMDDFSNHTTIDTFICTDSELILGSPAPGRVQWSHGGNSPVIPIREPGTYQLSVENTCGTYQFIYQVSEKVCDCELDLPNAFSPNGDNRNDIFTIIDQCRFRKWSLGSFHVYDQWGGMVYQELGQSVQWDGQSSDGEELPPGLYTFRLTATTQKRNEEETIQKVGTVYLLR